MKNIFQIIVASVMLCTAGLLNAQENMEDVVYLKNGNVYRGMIVEQVPGESIKIRTIGGNEFNVLITELAKITKEEKFQDAQSAPRVNEFDYYNRGYWKPWKSDTSRAGYHRKKRGYFFQSQILFEAVQGGVRIVNGYRFNRFAQLGVGVGADFVIASPRLFFSGLPDGYQGNYLPVYLYFGGDFLRSRVTPFYAIEAGYAWAFGNRDFFPFNDNRSNLRGGVMGGAGLGVRFNTKRRVNFSLLLNANFKRVRFQNTFESFDSNGNLVVVTERYRTTLFFPGLRFGVGF